MVVVVVGVPELNRIHFLNKMGAAFRRWLSPHCLASCLTSPLITSLKSINLSSGRSRCLQFWNCCLGRSNTTYRPKEECIYRLDWALIKREGEFDGSSRPQIGLRLQQGRDHLIVMINIALLCTNVSPAVRPATPSVVNMLEGRIAVQDICF
ncbi:probable LRR receptor-like serine/threonine-protein kinase At1g53430 isoform X2 [Vitis vinifera]|uniref:probable LRR receptor-like serine/threonine-protein kinase At1g53430 isoform X2 n=1 Tax=Vitis vinifera TaxID=29760 RepID=UPI0028831EDB|nr:probable LRR receptor-like serine/threonine-protein kinase At1g53430 isoform X2 [Vitis vinifera]